MNCQETRELFSEYLDQRLPSLEHASIEDHLKGCADCQRELAALKRTVALLGSLDDIETAPDFLSQVERKIAKGERIRRVWDWLFVPIKLKVPLEITALVVLSIIAFQISKSPERSRESDLERDLEDSKTAAQSRPAETRKKVTPAQESYRTAQPKTPSATRDSLAELVPAEAPRQAASQFKSEVTEAQAHEIFAPDLQVYRQKVEALLAELGGKIVREEVAESSVSLTVELPQSRKEALLSQMRADVGAKARGELAGKGEVSAAGRLEKKAADKAEAARPEDDPMVTLQLRILPKK